MKSIFKFRCLLLLPVFLAQTFAQNIWVKRNKYPYPYDFQSVIWAENRFLAITGGSVQTSPDGVVWTTVNSSMMPGIKSLAYTGSLYVAVGENDNITTSPDGLTWTIRYPPVGEHYRFVTWANGLLLAGGYVTYLHSGFLLTSTDGITWTKQNTGTTGYFASAVWADSQFVVMTDVGPYITSPDGTTWTYHRLQTDFEVRSTIWTGSELLAVGGNTVLKSSNLVDWNIYPVDSTRSFNSIIWTGNQFVTVGERGGIYTSPNGETWTQQTSGVDFELHCVTWTGSQFVAVGDYGTILTSSPGGSGILARANSGKGPIRHRPDFSKRPFGLVLPSKGQFGDPIYFRANGARSR